jgi:hypothetical protein
MERAGRTPGRAPGAQGAEPSPLIRRGLATVVLVAASAGIAIGIARPQPELLGDEPAPATLPHDVNAEASPTKPLELSRYAAAILAEARIPSDPGIASGGGLQPRPFRHSQHESVSCTSCHGVGDEHRVTIVRTPRDCAACHHGPDVTPRYSCSDCHSAADMPQPGPVPATLALSVWDEPRIRDLPFDHERHTELQCQDCHTSPILLSVERECASCHAEHHYPDAECTSCHLPTEPEAHDPQAHLTCSGSGCHSGESAERPALSRSLCIMCHTEQWDHEPGGDCASCHMIPADPVERPAGRSWSLRGLLGGP